MSYRNYKTIKIRKFNYESYLQQFVYKLLTAITNYLLAICFLTEKEKMYVHILLDIVT